MMTLFEIRDDGGDVETIMAKVRENLKRRDARGRTSDDERIANASPREAFALYYRTAGDQLHLLRAFQDPRPQGPIAAHGSVVKGRLKTFIRRLLAPYHRAIFARQAEFNASVVGVMERLLERFEKTGDDHRALLDEAHARLGTLEEQFEQATERDRESVERFAELRQEIILLQRRLDLVISELLQKMSGQGEVVVKVASPKEYLTGHSYVLFQDRCRGTRDEIKKRQEVYLPFFEKRVVSDEQTGTTRPLVTLDVGCGRGEFLELLRDHGIPGKGIDLNEEMVLLCRERGLDVEQANALDYLRIQFDDSLGGIIACQVIEHLTTEEMTELIRLSYEKLQKGGRAVFETINPLSILVSATNFYLDLSHIRQVHPVSVQFLAEAVGFSKAEIKFLAPYPAESQLQLLSVNDVAFQQINENFKRLNDILFGYQDYALICQK